MNILSNFKVWMVFLLLVVSSGIILFGGLNFGIDFTGGTIFQIHLDEKLSPQEMERVSQVFEQRLNWTGLKDIRVFTLSNEFVVIQIAESDPDEIQKNLLPFIAANLMLAGVDLNSCGNIQIMRLQSKGKLYI